jgi:hypothetical protein
MQIRVMFEWAIEVRSGVEALRIDRMQCAAYISIKTRVLWHSDASAGARCSDYSVTELGCQLHL